MASIRTKTASVYDKEGIAFKDPDGDCVMDFSDFAGASAIAKIERTGQIIFHTVGDTGVGTPEQENVAEALARDVDDKKPESSASFMIHLGDVMYSPNKAAHYADRFYRIYDHYNRMIFAIPGNHDGEVFPSTDPETLEAFNENFCSPKGQPPLATKFHMRMPNQPGPYWCLKAPFVDIVGLYSNAAEDVGIIANSIVGDKQKKWLEKRLAEIAADQKKGGSKRKALVMVMHHPPYARGFHESEIGHPGNPEMLKDIDDCCAAAKVVPDAVIAGHTHSFQYYARNYGASPSLKGFSSTVPYLIVGTGGIGLQRIPEPTGTKNSDGDVDFVAAYKDYGYVRATVSHTELKLEFIAIVGEHSEVRRQIRVDLKTRQIL